MNEQPHPEIPNDIPVYSIPILFSIMTRTSTDGKQIETRMTKWTPNSLYSKLRRYTSAQRSEIATLARPLSTNSKCWANCTNHQVSSSYVECVTSGWRGLKALAIWADCPACDHTACPVLKHPSHLSNMQPSAGPPDSRYPSIHLKPQGMRGSTKLKTLKTAMTNGMKRLEVSLSWELLWFSNMFNCKMSIGETSGGLYGTQKDLYRPQRRPLRHPKRPLRTHPWGIDLSWQTRKAAVSFLWPGQPTQRTSSLPLPKPSPLKINMHANMDLKSKT